MGATRQFILHKLLLLVLGNILSPCYAKVKSRQLAISEATSFKCQMTMSNTFYASGKYGQEVACIYQNDYIWPIDNFPSDLQQYYQADLLQGTLWIKIINARSKDARIVTTENTRYKILSSSPLQSSTNARASGTASTGVSPTLLNPASGKQTIFILRVSTTDSEPTYSLPALKRQIVGRTTTDTSPSIREQYSKCSFNQLNFVYADGQTVEINASVTAFATPAALVDAALQRLAALRRVSSVSTLATRMMIVLPPGTLGTPWLSNAGVNYWRSTYNDKWAMSLSAGMHEIGHNLGLLHSGEGTLDPDLSYGDKTGYMGYGQLSSTYPLKCFDGFKNWQLGWYASNALQIDDVSTPRRIAMVSFVDYDTAGRRPVLININNVYFLQFNRAKKFNKDTEEKRNMLTITRNDPSRSQSVAGLSVGEQYKVRNWQKMQQPLIIEVCSMSYDDNDPDRTDKLVVSIALGKSYCSLSLKK